MQKFKTLSTSRLAVFIGSAVLSLLVAWPLMVIAQDKPDKAKDPDPHAQHKDKQSPGDQNLASQIADLQAKVVKLETVLMKSQASGMTGMADKPPGGMAGMSASKKPSGGMGMMEDDKMMGMSGKKMGGGMGMDMDEMKSMDAMAGGKGGGMMDMDMMEMMGMMGMAPKSAGAMKNMSKMQMQAALPSFPGASHIYHVGATDFFLNHPDHIDLTAKQKGDLARLKEKAVLAKTSAQRKIDEAEQELWTLTSADEPDAAKIEAKIQEIEKLRGDQRMTFIRAVGGAAKLLTDEQRQALLGSGMDKTADTDKPDPHAGHKKP